MNYNLNVIISVCSDQWSGELLCVAVSTNDMLECSHMTSTNQSQPDAKFVTEKKQQQQQKKKKEWLWFKVWIGPS